MNLKPLIERPNTVKPIYCCPVCGTMYATQEHAKFCAESSPLEQQFPGLKIGDVIIVPQGYGWFRQKQWIAVTHPAIPGHKSHFRHRETYDFYYVVTHIGHHRDRLYPRHFHDNRHAHRGIVSIASRAICTGDESVHAWTSPSGHYGWKVAENQQDLQHLVEEVKELLGKPSDNLL